VAQPMHVKSIVAATVSAGLGYDAPLAPRPAATGGNYGVVPP